MRYTWKSFVFMPRNTNTKRLSALGRRCCCCLQTTTATTTTRNGDPAALITVVHTHTFIHTQSHTALHHTTHVCVCTHARGVLSTARAHTNTHAIVAAVVVVAIAHSPQFGANYAKTDSNFRLRMRRPAGSSSKCVVAYQTLCCAQSSIATRHVMGL